MDVRCPDNELRLFYRVLPGGDVEIACRDCRTKARRTNPDVELVLHRYDPAGRLVSTSEVGRGLRT